MTNFISYNKYQKVYMSITYYTGKATLFYKLLSLLPFFKMKKKSYLFMYNLNANKKSILIQTEKKNLVKKNEEKL